jgi:hypothetical protein
MIEKRQGAGLFTALIQISCGAARDPFSRSLGARWGASPDDDLVAISRNLQIAGAGEVNHGAGMFINGCLVGNFFDEDIKQRDIAGEFDGFDVRVVPLVEKLDPASVVTGTHDDPANPVHPLKQLFAFRRRLCHRFSPAAESRAAASLR